MGHYKAVQGLVHSGDLSAGHERALVPATGPEALTWKIVAKRLSVRRAEALALEDQAGKPFRHRGRRRAVKDADTRVAERDLAAAFGLKVSIDRARDCESGSVSFRCTTQAQLDEPCRQLLSATRPQNMAEHTNDDSSSCFEAHQLFKDYDGSTMTAAAEIWAE